MPDMNLAAGCTRCNGTGEYHGTRRDGSSYVSHCFACQGGGTYRRSFRNNAARRDYAAAPIAEVNRPAGAPTHANWTRFANAMPAESAWLLANNTPFAASLVTGVLRYGNLTPRQLACVQRNLPAVAHGPAAADDSASRTFAEAAAADLAILAGAVEPAVIPASIAIGTTPAGGPVTESEIRAGAPVLLSSLIATPAPAPAPVVTIDATNIRSALLTARTSGLRKPKLTLGLFEFRLGRADMAARAHTIYVYTRDNIRSTNWTYRAAIAADGRLFFARGVSHMDDSQMELVRDAAANPRNAAAAHGHDTTYCSCCRRLLTDPPSVMAGIGPVCIRRFGWGF